MWNYPTKAGALGYFARRLAAKEINITSGFATTVRVRRSERSVRGV